MAALVEVSPDLAPFVTRTPRGEASIDFTHPRAVLELNRALLALHYGVLAWDLPRGRLCPPIPGRVDYLHHLADLLAEGGEIPRGPGVRVLDLGTGASLIYPLLGHAEYGWSFVGTDIDAGALDHAEALAEANGLGEAVELRLQGKPAQVLEGMLQPDERFAACLCNPPFHASGAAAREGSQRKWEKLGRGEEEGRPLLNFGGQARELWCRGGELAFITTLIRESAEAPQACRWFTTLVSRSEHLKRLQAACREAGAADLRVVEMGQGQKRSRFLAWRFA